jgi:hypothetical protein
MRLCAPLIALILGACVSTNAVQLNPTAQRAPVCPNAVQLYTDSSKVGAPFEEVAILNSKGESGWTSERGMYESMRRKASELGANGVILAPVQEPKAGTKIIGALLGTGAERKGGATAIWVPRDSSRVNEHCDGKKNRA